MNQPILPRLHPPMNRLLNTLLPASLLLLVFALSSALIVAAWLMIAFCLSGINRFALPMGLFGLVLCNIGSSLHAQPIPADEYIVIYERTASSPTTPPRPTQLVADSTQRTRPVISRERRRTIKFIPTWSDEPQLEQNAPTPANKPTFLFIPDVKPGSTETRGFYGIRIRP